MLVLRPWGHRPVTRRVRAIARDDSCDTAPQLSSVNWESLHMPKRYQGPSGIARLSSNRDQQIGSRYPYFYFLW